MTNVTNKDDALLCLGVAKQALQDNDIAKARWFVAKAWKLYVFMEVRLFCLVFGLNRDVHFHYLANVG